MDVSPMVWRRVQIPETFTLRQLHGVIQVAMGWEGAHLFQFHLRAIRYGSFELCTHSPEKPFGSLKLRKGTRFVYEYDLNAPWRHEIRLEQRIESISERRYPLCLDGRGNCPPEDCDGPAGYMRSRDAQFSLDAIADVDDIASVLDEVVIEGRREVLLDTGTCTRVEDAIERMKERERWKGRPFQQRAVNADFEQGRYLDLMHQQY